MLSQGGSGIPNFRYGSGYSFFKYRFQPKFSVIFSINAKFKGSTVHYAGYRYVLRRERLLFWLFTGSEDLFSYKLP
jgi:hypothetical protein